jgi:hypothetical protein
MSRRDELVKLIPEESIELLDDVIDEVIFLESKLDELRKLPFIQIHPKDSSKQKNTPAAKMYKEFLQQYINCIKVIESAIYHDKRLEVDEAEESPLRKWFSDHVN